MICYMKINTDIIQIFSSNGNDAKHSNDLYLKYLSDWINRFYENYRGTQMWFVWIKLKWKWFLILERFVQFLTNPWSFSHRFCYVDQQFVILFS